MNPKLVSELVDRMPKFPEGVMKQNKPSITFALNDLFKENNNDLDGFWAALLGQFEFVVTQCAWPRPQHPERVIMDLRPFFECNNVYDLLREDDEDIRLVIQETGPYSGMTLKMTDQVKGIFPKSSWFIQRQPKLGQWKNPVPLQNTAVFHFPNGEFWGFTRQPDGAVVVAERIVLDERDLVPQPIGLYRASSE